MESPGSGRRVAPSSALLERPGGEEEAAIGAVDEVQVLAGVVKGILSLVPMLMPIDLTNPYRITALTEKGERVNGRGFTPNMHDILTGSQPNGMALAGDASKTTCGNWTLSGAGAAMVGHHDRLGVGDNESAWSWNSSHPSRGCSQDNLRASGGAEMFYCFAAK